MSPAAPLKSLSISAFRGSSTKFTLSFEKGCKLTIIYGENGTGKTTICDAFELLAHDRVSSLHEYGLGKGLEKYWPTVGKMVEDLSVTLETDADVCSGSIVGREVQVNPTTLRPRIELLRRQKILDLIKAQPAERYEAIRRFIDIPAFEASEEALRQEAKAMVIERKSAEQAEGQSLRELQDFYEAAGQPEGLNAVTWAKEKIARPTIVLDDDIVAIGKLRAAFDALRPIPGIAELREKAIATATVALSEADESLAKVASAGASGLAETLELLEAGSKYLLDHPANAECPLCRSQENATGLFDSLKTRLADMEALRIATRRRQECAAALMSMQDALKQLDVDVASTVAQYLRVKTSHQWNSETSLPSEGPAPNVSAIAAWLVANEEISKTWPATESSWRDEKMFVHTLVAACDRYDHNTTKLTELASLLPKMEEALKLSVEQRQGFTNRIIAGIAQRVGELYEQVHPGEGLDKIALPLDPKKRASLELAANFSGQSVPPQAYFSQSHLDTLGLCVFLALRKFSVRMSPGRASI